MSTKVNLNEIEISKNFSLKKQERIQSQSFRANDYERVPNSDKLEIADKKSNAAKWTVGTIVGVSVIGLGILGRKGKLGPYIRELLGGKKKNSEIKDTLESLLDKHKGKKLEELTTEEKNKFIDVLNPDNKPEIRQKIEAEFEQMQDKSISEAVDSAKTKLDNLNSEVLNPDKAKDSVNAAEKRAESIEEPKQPENQIEVSDTQKKKKKKKTSSDFDGGRDQFREIHSDDVEKQIDNLSESDRRNNAWLEQQHSIKEKEYDEFWQNALREQDEQIEAEFDTMLDEYFEQLSKDPKFVERDSAEIADDLLNKMAEYSQLLGTRTMSDGNKLAAFCTSMHPQMQEQDVAVLANRFGLSSVFEQTGKVISYNGQEFKTLCKIQENIYLLSDGKMLDTATGRMTYPNRCNYDDLIANIEETQIKVRNMQEGRQRYEELNSQLDGKISVRVNDKKSEELQDLAEIYQAEEDAAKVSGIQGDK